MAKQGEKTVTVKIDAKPKEDMMYTYPDGTKWYFYEDGSTKNFVTVEETSNPDNLPGYMRATHHAEYRYRVAGIMYNEKKIVETNPRNSYASVSVYYCTGDRNHTPLIIQLGYMTDYSTQLKYPNSRLTIGHYFYLFDKEKNKWESSYIGSSTDLLKKLDDENCRNNNIHIVDIEQTSNNYKCPNCGFVIKIENYSSMSGIHGYELYEHSAEMYNFTGRIKEGPVNLTGFDTHDTILSVFAFHYKNQIPLICTRFASGEDTYQWYRREKKYGAHWIKVPSLLSPYDYKDILHLLKEINGENFNLLNKIKIPLLCTVICSLAICSTTEAYCILFSQNRSLMLRGIRFLARLRS